MEPTNLPEEEVLPAAAAIHPEEEVLPAAAAIHPEGEVLPAAARVHPVETHHQGAVTAQAVPGAAAALPMVRSTAATLPAATVLDLRCPIPAGFGL